MKTAVKHLFIIAISVILSGCAPARNMALVNTSAEPYRIFTNPQPEDEYRLYYHGPDDEPIAYLALQPAYRLESDFWFPLKMNPAMQKRITDQVRTDSFRRGSEFLGTQIVAPQNGETIGFVLSSYHRVTAWFNDQEDKTVIIPPPELAQGQPLPLTFARSRK